MNERLDYLLSVELDDELEPAEREELDRLLADHPEAADRRASFASINAFVQNIADQPAAGVGVHDEESALDAGLASIHARIGKSEDAPGDDLARRRRLTPTWIPSIGLAAAAAAAMALYLVVPSGPTIQNGGADSTGGALLVEDPIALAVLFEVDEDSDTIGFIDSMTADDFEIIEQLELLEFLAAREEEGRG